MPAPWKLQRSQGSSTISVRAVGNARDAWLRSGWERCTQPTAICCTNSSRHPANQRTDQYGRQRGEPCPSWCWKWLDAVSQDGAPSALASACRRLAASRMWIMARTKKKTLYLISELAKRGIAYLHMSEPGLERAANLTVKLSVRKSATASGGDHWRWRLHSRKSQRSYQ